MGDNWESLSLKEAGVEVIDCVHKTPPSTKEGFPYVGIPQIVDGRINTADARRISEKDFKEWTKKALPKANDVVLSRRCNPGVTAHVSGGDKFALGQNLVLLRADGSKVYPPLLRWLVSGPCWWSEVAKFENVGAVFNSLRCADIPSFKLPIPPKSEQCSIAHILGSLDDKIELNRQMNRTLEQMAQTIFKSWFIDFDPVVLNAVKAGNPVPERFEETAARYRQNPDALKLPQDILDLFPDRFEESELGEIPKGWFAAPMSSMIHLIGGGTPKTKIAEYWDGDIPWYSVVDAPAESDVWVVDTEKHVTQLGVANSSTKVLPERTTIISARGTVGKCALVARPMAMNQSCYGIRPKKEEIGEYFVNFIVRDKIAALQRSGHGSVFNTITRSTFDAIKVTVPSSEITRCFDEQVMDHLSYILRNLEENIVLARMRDTLLPKLISGELRVPEMEKVAEETV